MTECYIPNTITTEQLSHKYRHVGSLLETRRLDSGQWDVSHVKDVANFQLDLFGVQDWVIGTGTEVGERRLKAQQAVWINVDAVKLQLDLCRTKLNKSDDALVCFCLFVSICWVCVRSVECRTRPVFAPCGKMGGG